MTAPRHLSPLLVTFTIVLITLAGDVVGQSIWSTAASNTSMPIVDDSHVPTMMRYYSSQTPDIALLQDWSNISTPPARTSNYAWFVSDTHYIYSYRIHANDVTTAPNTIIRSAKFLHTTDSLTGDSTFCAQPVISPTKFNEMTYILYIVCQPNYIFSFQANDETGQMGGITYDYPIRVDFNTLDTSLPKLTGNLTVEQQNGGTTPDFLIVSGSGALFTIDSSTGLHARQQWGPKNTGISTFDISPLSPTMKIQFLMKTSWNSAVGADFIQMYCVTNITSNFFGFVLTFQQGSTNATNSGKWTVAWNTQFVGGDWNTVRIFETPSYIYYYFYGRKYWTKESVYQLSKQAPYSLRGVTNQNSYEPLMIFYESPMASNIVLAISGSSYSNPFIYSLDFTNNVITDQWAPTVSYGTPVLDPQNDRIWYVGWTKIAVVKLSSLLSLGKYDELWSYQTIQDLSNPFTNHTQVSFSTWNESPSYGTKLVVPGAPGSNSIVVFGAFYATQNRYGMSVKVLSSMVAPLCSELPAPPKYNASNPASVKPECYCTQLATARTCAYSNSTGLCANFYSLTSPPICESPILGPQTSESSTDATTIILGIVLPIIFVSICGCACIYAHLAECQKSCEKDCGMNPLAWCIVIAVAICTCCFCCGTRMPKKKEGEENKTATGELHQITSVVSGHQPVNAAPSLNGMEMTPRSPSGGNSPQAGAYQPHYYQLTTDQPQGHVHPQQIQQPQPQQQQYHPSQPGEQHPQPFYPQSPSHQYQVQYQYQQHQLPQPELHPPVYDASAPPPSYNSQHHLHQLEGESITPPHQHYFGQISPVGAEGRTA